MADTRVEKLAAKLRPQFNSLADARVFAKQNIGEAEAAGLLVIDRAMFATDLTTYLDDHLDLVGLDGTEVAAAITAFLTERTTP